MIERDFYPLTMAAGKIGCTVDDLLHIAARGEVQIIVLASGLRACLFDENDQPVPEASEIITDRYCLVHKAAIMRYETAKAYRQFPYGRLNLLLTPDDSGNYWHLSDRAFIIMHPEFFFVLTRDVNSLRDAAASLQKSSETDKPTKQLTETERNIMLKLIIGMAIDAYGYDPHNSRNSATGGKNGISAKLQVHDISISGRHSKILNRSKRITTPAKPVTARIITDRL